MASYDEHVEGLYDLDSSELRQLAYECLLISDGPARAEPKSQPVGQAMVALYVLSSMIDGLVTEDLEWRQRH